ncbi:hypothetical protein L7F22_003282 [Adiantum nelumboides]|nr:hypothetical protein [Adiantum nelumboides]
MTENNAQSHATNATVDTFTEFDYVVVGGGPGGMACAAALSENSKVTVGVLEAGSWLPNDPLIEYPSMMGQSIMNPKYDWCLKTTPQKYSNDREWILPRGKMLGGSSAMNFMCWQRGYRTDFDDIAKLGNPGWDWDSLTPAYTELTQTTTSDLTQLQKDHGGAIEKGCHGTSGPVGVSHSVWYCEAQKEWWNMFLTNGSKHVQDGSGSGEMHGLWNTLFSVDPQTRKRTHAGTAFYEKGDYAKRSNFKVLCDATAVKVEFSRDRATGVSYLHDGKQYNVKAKREVILAGGTFLTPKLLELSGIGDEAILQKYNVPVKIKNENVGKNLQEHFYLGSVFEVKEDVITYDKLKDSEFAQKAMAYYSDSPDTDLTGGIIGAPCCSAFGYLSLKDLLSPEELAELKAMADFGDNQEGWSDGMKRVQELQLAKLFFDRAPAMEYTLLPAFATTDGTPKDGTGYVTNLSLSQYPLSRGTVHIQSSDPNEPPSIDPNYFSNPADLRLMAYALRKGVDNIEKDPGMAKHIIERHAPKKEESKTIEDYEEFIRKHASTTYHPVGTCSMMPREMGGVVDAQLRVYGTQNLRIADASILPVMPSGHIQSACYVIGHKAANMMLKQVI